MVMNSLYLHIPFCLRKCPYCDFFSTQHHSASDLDAYVGLLLEHLELAYSRSGPPAPLDSIFFGGGTPSLLEPMAVGRLLAAAQQRFGFSSDIEISLEANPGTLSPTRLEGFRTAGVNRLSLGLQTQNPGMLRQLGRPHSPADGLQAVRWARQAGFDNLSLDLMFALPGQTLPDLLADIQAYLALEPEHFSCYGLTAEADTPLAAAVAKGAVLLPDSDFYADAFLCLHEQLEAAGYEHYEIANYARAGLFCRHNLGYWQRQPCLGLGAGAHSFSAVDWGERWAVPAALAEFRSAIAAGRNPAKFLERFDHRGAMAETLYLGLRTARGVDEQWFREHFGAGVAECFPKQVEQLAAHLACHDGTWRFHPQSWLLYDHLIQGFL